MKVFRFTLAAVFNIAGVLHFLRAKGFEAIVPQILPFKKMIVWVSGIIEIIFGILLLVKKPNQVIKNLIVGFLLAIFPANIYMAKHEIPLGDIQPPKWALIARLPLQFVLIKLVRKM